MQTSEKNYECSFQRSFQQPLRFQSVRCSLGWKNGSRVTKFFISYANNICSFFQKKSFQ
ncbi:unnamed protein product [Brassica oleracea var. botrytis]